MSEHYSVEILVAKQLWSERVKFRKPEVSEASKNFENTKSYSSGNVCCIQSIIHRFITTISRIMFTKKFKKETIINRIYVPLINLLKPAQNTIIALIAVSCEWQSHISFVYFYYSFQYGIWYCINYCHSSRNDTPKVDTHLVYAG